MPSEGVGAMLKNCKRSIVLDTDNSAVGWVSRRRNPTLAAGSDGVSQSHDGEDAIAPEKQSSPRWVSVAQPNTGRLSGRIGKMSICAALAQATNYPIPSPHGVTPMPLKFQPFRKA